MMFCHNQKKTTFRNALLRQSQQLLSGSSDGSIKHALAKIGKLAVKQEKYAQLERVDVTSLFGLIDDCINLGTIPFSILARHGFIAKTLLDSLERCGILSIQDVNQILSGFNTVASDLVDDMHKMQIGKLPRSSFMAKYGHLRPGTYDILSKRYDQMSD